MTDAETDDTVVDGPPTMYVKAEKRARRAMSATQWTDTEGEASATDFQSQVLYHLASVDKKVSDLTDWMVDTQHSELKWLIVTLATMAMAFIVLIALVVLR